MSRLYERISTAIMEGEPEKTAQLVQKCLDQGLNPKEILDNAMIVGMGEVGVRFKAGDMFVPEVLMSADSMQAGLVVLRPHLVAGGVKLMVDFHNRWNPAMWGIKEKVVAGELGDPQMLTVRLNDTIYVPTEMLSWGGRSTVIWFLGSHAVDLVRWLFDDEVARVYSVSRSRVLKGMGVDTPDFFLTIVELEGGGVAHIENCWIMSTSMPTVFDFKLEMIGSEGTCFADCSSHRMLQTFTPAGPSYPDVAVRTEVQGVPGGFGINSIRHFADCVIHDREPAIGVADGLENTRVLVAIHESARSGQPVEVQR